MKEPPMHKKSGVRFDFSPPRRSPLALLVATLAGSATASAQDATGPVWPISIAQVQSTSRQDSSGNGPPPDIEEIVTIGRQRSTAIDVVGARLEEDVVSDFLSAAAISRVGDSTVSAALRRVPGLTLVNDQFVYVRGLGERYSSVQLNGAQVPSPDLTRNVIPLDIFPTEIIDALQVQKGYAPDQPAAFGGGNVDIKTRGLPNGPVVNIEIGSGLNSDADDEGLSYRGGRRDGLGRDDGTRAFPSALQSALQTYRGDLSPAGILTALDRDGTPHSLAEAEAINRSLALSLNRNVEIERKNLGPDSSLEVALGNRWFVSDDDAWRVGVLGLVSYDNVWRNRERVERDVTDPLLLVETKNRTINAVSTTGVVNLGVSYTDDHEIATSSLYLRNTDDESAIATRTTNNFQISDGEQLRDYDVRYEQRELTVSQIRGHHTIGLDTRQSHAFLDREWLDGLTFDWYASDARANTDIPNEVKFSAEDQVDPLTGEVLQTALRRSASAADFRFTYLKDEVRSSGWDLVKPFYFEHVEVSLSLGQDVSDKARSYTQTQFGLGTTATAATPILQGTPGTVFSDANVGNPDYRFGLTAGGIGTESYLAAQTNDAAYVKADVLVADRWRFAGGVRSEKFRQASLPIDVLQYDVNVGQCALSPCDAAALERVKFTEDDLYPALAVTRIFRDVWARDFQLRIGLSDTVARPDLREISGSSYIDPLTETRIRGNPALVTSAIGNFDLRAEWFFENGDNFTASLFYKDIENPIETVQAAGTDDNISLTFINAQSAKVSGVEIEWLKDLSSLNWDFLDPFFFAGNVTLSDSELTVGHSAFNLTSAVRPMAQHSEYVANFQLGFDSPNGMHTFTLAYNTFGERLFFAGRDGAPDAYEQPFDSLDLVYSFFPTDRISMKFRIQNLLDEKLVIEQRGVDVISQSVGTTAKLDVKWDLGN
jgi:outer membrane receptor protein involved in Fe transport